MSISPTLYPEWPEPDAPPHRGAATYVAAWVAVSAVVLVAFYFIAAAYMERERDQELRALERSAEFSGTLIAGEITRLRENAEAVAAHQGFAIRTGLYFDGDESIGPFLQERIESEVRARGYVCVQLLDTAGTVHFTAGDPAQCTAFDDDLVFVALESREVVKHDLELEDGLPRSVRWAVPLIRSADNTTTGAVLLTSDLTPVVEGALSVPGHYESMRLALVDDVTPSAAEEGRMVARAPLAGTPWEVEASVSRAEAMRASSVLTVAGGLVVALVSMVFGLGLFLLRRVALQRDAEQAAKRVLARRIEAEERFIANMSHELRTPLNSIIGFAQVLGSGSVGPVNEEQRTQLGLVSAAGKRMLALVNDLLDLSKVRAGMTVPHSSEFTAADVVAHVADITCPLSKEKGLECSRSMPSHEIALHTDRELLERALLNLAGNAIKFTPTGGSITLEVREVPRSGMVEFSITDTGYGIAADEMGRIMDEFFQGTSVPGDVRAAGTGLGLPISLRIARLLGGTIDFTSELGKGSTFVLRIPRQLPGASITMRSQS